MYICLLKKDDCMSHCKYPFLGLSMKTLTETRKLKSSEFGFTYLWICTFNVLKY